MKLCRNCGAQIEDHRDVCPACGAKYETEMPRETLQADAGNDEIGSFPMKWHNFLMVALIIGAIYSAYNGICLAAGMQYRDAGFEAYEVYREFPGLQVADQGAGIATVALAVFQIIVRNRLNQFRENGPMLMKVLFILSIAVEIFYMAVATASTKVNFFSPVNVATAAADLALLIGNSVYYGKRKALFNT